MAAWERKRSFYPCPCPCSRSLPAASSVCPKMVGMGFFRLQRSDREVPHGLHKVVSAGPERGICDSSTNWREVIKPFGPKVSDKTPLHPSERCSLGLILSSRPSSASPGCPSQDTPIPGSWEVVELVPSRPDQLSILRRATEASQLPPSLLFRIHGNNSSGWGGSKLSPLL